MRPQSQVGVLARTSDFGVLCATITPKTVSRVLIIPRLLQSTVAKQLWSDEDPVLQKKHAQKVPAKLTKFEKRKKKTETVAKEKETVSLGYPLSVFNKNSTLKPPPKKTSRALHSSDSTWSV